MVFETKLQYLGEENYNNAHTMLFGVEIPGFLPKFMNGIVKSTALSRSEVIVRSVMPKSAL